MPVRDDGPELSDRDAAVHGYLGLADAGTVSGGAEEQYSYAMHGLPLGLRDVPGSDDDLQGARDHDEIGRIVADNLAVDGELEPWLGLDPDLSGPLEEDAIFVQVVRFGERGRGEREDLLEPDVLYDDHVQEPVFGVGPRGGGPTSTGVTAVADGHVDGPHPVFLAVQVQHYLPHVEVAG